LDYFLINPRWSHAPARAKEATDDKAGAGRGWQGAYTQQRRRRHGTQFVRCNKIKLKFETTTGQQQHWNMQVERRQRGEGVTSGSENSVGSCLASCVCVCVECTWAYERWANPSPFIVITFFSPLHPFGYFPIIISSLLSFHS